MGEVSSELLESTNSIQQDISLLRDAQLVSIAGIIKIAESLSEMDVKIDAILETLKKQEMEREILDDLKIFLITIEGELEKIETISKTHPEYAALLSEDLFNLLETNNVDYTRFKRMRPDDIKWAKSVIDKVGKTKLAMFTKLE